MLFVCLGNICRSPLAEGVFRQLLEERGVAAEFEVDSAGTSGYHDGDPADPRTAAVARRRGVSLTSISRRITAQDLARFDHIIVMDEENLAAVQRLAERAGADVEIRRLREFDPDADSLDVPDPYYEGPDGFEHVHDIVERACAGLVEHLVQEHRG